MLGVWGKFKCTGFFMLLSYSSFFTINSDLPVNSLLFYFSRGFYKEKKKIGIFLKLSKFNSKEVILEN